MKENENKRKYMRRLRAIWIFIKWGIPEIWIIEKPPGWRRTIKAAWIAAWIMASPERK